ncbi:uncharacterized protein H6S33_001790 [Morchella sextelata]|uniref:uncharacterized protein n=1 Tax=Morchella sextelata TaxID=1174677 RepID=UPI001D04F07F|nr:uncharacterized protein H6S33_001790 [Morchella sextelata]KAH0608656.1 hypothetical protein H6S33_001790 [Morchella sextelata]
MGTGMGQEYEENLAEPKTQVSTYDPKSCTAFLPPESWIYMIKLAVRCDMLRGYTPPRALLHGSESMMSKKIMV